MAAAGSAIGLGNIWRFPYICGQYGGAACLVVYLAFVFLIGMVLLMTEFVIGRRSGFAPEKAFPALYPKHPSWKIVGLYGMLTCFLILVDACIRKALVLYGVLQRCIGVLQCLGIALI